jgi:hypothetical protein
MRRALALALRARWSVHSAAQPQPKKKRESADFADLHIFREEEEIKEKELDHE